MKLTSVLPWLQATPLSPKGILLFGFHEELISYRLKFLQNYYAGQKIQHVYVDSLPEMLDLLRGSQTLFEPAVSKKCIIYQNSTDSLLKNEAFIPLLTASAHILLMTSSKLNSRSKLVASFQSLEKTAVIPCYDVDLREISQTVSFYSAQKNLTLDASTQEYLTGFLSSHLGEFFSILNILELYAASNTLTEQDVKNSLKEFSDFKIENFNQHFFLGHVSALNILLEKIEMVDWISVLRQLLQDLVTLMCLQIQGATPASLKDLWAKGTVKFPYPRLSFYQKCLGNWSLKRCGVTLERLLRLEVALKSSSPPCLTEVPHHLLILSSQR